MWLTRQEAQVGVRSGWDMTDAELIRKLDGGIVNCTRYRSWISNSRVLKQSIPGGIWRFSSIGSKPQMGAFLKILRAP